MNDIERVEITKAEKEWLETSSMGFANPTYGSSSVHRQSSNHVLLDSGFSTSENNDAPIGLTDANNNNMIISVGSTLPTVDENYPTSCSLPINGEFGKVQAVDENCPTSYTLPIDGDFRKVQAVDGNCPTSYSLPIDAEFGKVQPDTDRSFGEHAMWTSPDISETSTFGEALCMGPLSSPQYSTSEWETIVSSLSEDPQRSHYDVNNVCNSPSEFRFQSWML